MALNDGDELACTILDGTFTQTGKSICISGASPGADTIWGNEAIKSKYDVIHIVGPENTIDESVKTIGAGQSTYVPLGSIHRLENREKELLIIIEVQIGDYLGEDDIIRYEDIYSRK
mgnify:CR=1 FL=1